MHWIFINYLTLFYARIVKLQLLVITTKMGENRIYTQSLAPYYGGYTPTIRDSSVLCLLR